MRASTANVYRDRSHVILFIVVPLQALYSFRCHIWARLLLFSVPAKAFVFYGAAVALCEFLLCRQARYSLFKCHGRALWFCIVPDGTPIACVAAADWVIVRLPCFGWNR